MAVGLPDGQMGNPKWASEYGCRRIVYQELTRITKEIQDGTFFENPALMEAVENCKAKELSLHLFELLSTRCAQSQHTFIRTAELAKKEWAVRGIRALFPCDVIRPHPEKGFARA